MAQKKEASSTKARIVAKKPASRSAGTKSAAVSEDKKKRAPVKKAAATHKSKPAVTADSKAKPAVVKSRVQPSTTTGSNAKPSATPKARTEAKVKSSPKPKTAVTKKTTAKASTVSASGKKTVEVKKSAPKAAVKQPAIRNKTTAAESVIPEIKQSGSRKQSGANLKFLVGVAQAIKTAVAPLALAVKGREVVDEAPSGDVTFLLDRVAEKALFSHLKAAALPIAYYSEHEGYSTFSSKPPKSLLIVDPIDGTRAAKSGFEGCVVAVASTRVIERPTIADIDCACVMDLLGERIFLAERGKGARVYVGGHLKRPKLSENADLESMIWSMTIPARPAELIFPTAARIIDLSSLKGGFFACNSTSFSLTRLVTNQLDACIDIANRYYRDIPDRVEDYFINAGRGKVIGVAPYDIAASLLIAEEAGCTVTDAYGKKFNNLLLLDSSKGNHQSIIAASNAQLHEKLLNFFDTRIRQYEQLLTRHTAGD